MAKPGKESAIDRLRRWQERIAAADRVYKDWSEKFHCDRLKNYWLGKQWAGKSETDAEALYVINKIFPAIATQLPSLLFSRPSVKVEPRPPHADDVASTAGARAELAQHTIQTLIDDPKVHFKANTLLPLLDAQFRFGIVEVGYSADWIDNPNAGKPALNEHDEDIEGTTQPARFVKEGTESVFVKRLPPHTFRVSQSGRNILGENDWAGYYEWHFVEDVKANPDYKHTATLKPSGSLAGTDPDTSSDPDAKKYAGMVKLWKIWDLRSKVKHVIAEGHDKWLQEGKPYKHLPFAALKFHEIPDEWYPLPPVTNWIAPQDEINETRESRRVHRKRFYRRYLRTPLLSQTEYDKLNDGGDGACAEVPDLTVMPLQPVQDAGLGPDTDKHLMESQADFNEIAGSSAESRGEAEADTATQANIINVRQQIRESFGRTQVAEWLSQICRLILICVIEKMQYPMWVKINSDPFAMDQMQALKLQQGWQMIKSEQLGDLDVDVKIELSSMSPVTEDSQRMAWNQVLALLTNPALLMVLMASEPLLKKTLGFYGIKSDAEIKEIQKVGQLTLLMQTMAAQGAAGGAGMPGAPGADPVGTPSEAPMGMQ